MDTLPLKLVLTPVLILLVSAVGRRWGSGIGGFLIGLPLTSGPICLFIALEQGPPFAAGAAVGAMAGIIAVAGACVAYGVMAARGAGRGVCLVSGWVAYGCVAAALHGPAHSVETIFAAAVVSLCVAASLLRDGHGASGRAPGRRGWEDAAARAVAATLMVVVLTALAEGLGPRLSGLLAPFPIYTSVLVAFAHAEGGAPAARRLLRGQMVGSLSFAVFFLIIALQVEHLGIAAAFALAVGATLVSHGLIFVQFFRAGRQRSSGSLAFDGNRGMTVMGRHNRSEETSWIS